ncbi:MAG: VOC family protein [Hyphomicrobiales bacterium]
MAEVYGVTPSIRVRDVPRAFRFYTETLGFDVRRGGPDDDNISLTRGNASLMLEGAGNFYSDAYNKAIQERLGTPSANAFYMEATDLDALNERVMKAGAKIIDPLAARQWGQREFTVEDPEGNWLTFWEALK